MGAQIIKYLKSVYIGSTGLFSHIHVLAVYVKKGAPFARDSSFENSYDSYCFRLALLYSVGNFPIDHHVLLYTQFLMLFSNASLVFFGLFICLLIFLFIYNHIYC